MGYFKYEGSKEMDWMLCMIFTELTSDVVKTLHTQKNYNFLPVAD